MESMRATWTDDRLDDFARNTGARFDRVDARFDRVETEIAGLRTEMREEFRSVRTEMNAGFGALQGEFAALNRILIQIAYGLVGLCVIASITLVATQLWPARGRRQGPGDALPFRDPCA